MSKTIIVGGYGPGISAAIAEKFGAEGFSLALVGRNHERLGAAAKQLASKGLNAKAFPADLGDPTATRALVDDVRRDLGPITVLHWNAYGGGAGDLLTASAADVRGVFDVAVSGLVAAVQAALPDLRHQADAAVLVTNGGLGLADPKIDALAVQWNAMGLAMANAAKHKLVGLLAEKLRPLRIYVGEVVVLGIVKGTSFDKGQGTIDAHIIADKFWALYQARTEVTAQIG